MYKKLTLIPLLLLPCISLSSEQFMQDCDRHLRSEQSALISSDKQKIQAYLEQDLSDEERKEILDFEKQYDEKINNEIKAMCTCMKDKTVSALKVTGLSDEEISASLHDLGKAMIHQNYFMIDEVTRKSFEQAALCSL